jgi:ribosome-associated heat shock protein Hsp15
MEKRETIRLDKWLWYARFFKTRGLATKTVKASHVRLNSVKIDKASQTVGAGDRLEFLQGRVTRIVTIQACGVRRGPAPEAQTLYEDHTPEAEPKEFVPSVPVFEGKGRPTKKDRRKGLLSEKDFFSGA